MHSLQNKGVLPEPRRAGVIPAPLRPAAAPWAPGGPAARGCRGPGDTAPTTWTSCWGSCSRERTAVWSSGGGRGQKRKEESDNAPYSRPCALCCDSCLQECGVIWLVEGGERKDKRDGEVVLTTRPTCWRGRLPAGQCGSLQSVCGC